MKKITFFIFLMISIFSVSCGRLVPFRDVPVLTYSAKADSSRVEKAIYESAAKRDWTVKKIKKDKYQLTFVKKAHMVKVDLIVKTRMQEIEFKYVDSSQMLYDGEKKTIHRKYFQWVENLKKDIRVNLAY